MAILLRFYNRRALRFLGFFATRKTAAHHGQGKCHPDSATGTITTDSIYFFLQLHCNNKYIDFEKLSEFDLDFGCFWYKINKFGRKTKQDSYEVIHQAVSRATNRAVHHG
jgi:hypothetical protein